jgi:hypothetical protein
MERLDVRELVNVFGGAPVGEAAGGVDIGVTPPFVKNCTLRPEITRGMGVISGSIALTLDRSSI